MDDQRTNAAALDRMGLIEPRALSFDIWARGNYTRRLIHHERTDAAPLFGPVSDGCTDAMGLPAAGAPRVAGRFHLHRWRLEAEEEP